MIDKERAGRIMDAYSGQSILVVGDLMLDRYVYGTVSRISPEAPVPVVHVTEEHCLPGGAANVALNIQSLGGRAIVAGIAGRDRASEELMAVLSDNGISTDGVVVHDKVETTVKTRILAERQQVVRVDREGPPESAAIVMKDFCRKIDGLIGDAAGVIIEDYGKGAVSQEVIDVTLSVAGDLKIPVGFDPKDNHDLKLSGITLATPNYREARAAAGLPESALSDELETDGNLAETAEKLLKKWRSALLIITLGSRGMYLMGKGEGPRVIPTKAREVFDVSGAGDTVIATALLSLVSGASNYEAALLANHAAGVVVGKVGTATCTREELLESIA